MKPNEWCLSLWLLLLVTGCSSTVERTPMLPREPVVAPGKPRYTMVHRFTRLATGAHELQLTTRATGCLPRNSGIQSDDVVTERLELLGPDNYLIHSLEKTPARVGAGRFEGRFVIDLPESTPLGQYQLVASLYLNGTLCGKKIGGFTRHSRSDSRRSRPERDILNEGI